MFSHVLSDSSVEEAVQGCPPRGPPPPAAVSHWRQQNFDRFTVLVTQDSKALRGSEGKHGVQVALQDNSIKQREPKPSGLGLECISVEYLNNWEDVINTYTHNIYKTTVFICCLFVCYCWFWCWRWVNFNLCLYTELVVDLVLPNETQAQKVNKKLFLRIYHL